MLELFVLISFSAPQRARLPPWNNIKLFVSPEPSSRAFLFSVTSLRTFTFKSFNRCPLHYSTTTSLCGFLENLKDPFVPPPTFIPFLLLFILSPLLLLSFSKPLPAPRICTAASYSWCRYESRNLVRNFLNNSYSHICIMATLWKFARAKWIIRPCESRFSNDSERFLICLCDFIISQYLIKQDLNNFIEF